MTGLFEFFSQFIELVVYDAYVWINYIISQPVLVLFCFAIPLVGLGIGVIRRLVRIRA